MDSIIMGGAIILRAIASLTPLGAGTSIIYEGKN
jgi:hypothetical protein